MCYDTLAILNNSIEVCTLLNNTDIASYNAEKVQ